MAGDVPNSFAEGLQAAADFLETIGEESLADLYEVFRMWAAATLTEGSFVHLQEDVARALPNLGEHAVIPLLALLDVDAEFDEGVSLGPRARTLIDTVRRRYGGALERVVLANAGGTDWLESKVRAVAQLSGPRQQFRVALEITLRNGQVVKMEMPPSSFVSLSLNLLEHLTELHPALLQTVPTARKDEAISFLRRSAEVLESQSWGPLSAS